MNPKSDNVIIPSLGSPVIFTLKQVDLGPFMRQTCLGSQSLKNNFGIFLVATL